MAVTLSNGKVTISENAITVKRFLGSDVIQKKHIESIDKVSGIFWAIWFTLWIISILRAIPLYRGKYEVTIKTSDKKYSFYLSKPDYQLLQENL